MIAFDNGPRDGDYVRYIEDLVASRAAVLGSGASLSGYESGARGMPTDPMRRTAVPDGMSVAPQATSASAVASRLMSGRQVDRGTFVVSAIASTLGLILVLVGILMTPFNTALLIAGIALLSWALKRIATRVLPSEGATAANPSGDTRRVAVRRASIPPRT